MTDITVLEILLKFAIQFVVTVEGFHQKHAMMALLTGMDASQIVQAIIQHMFVLEEIQIILIYAVH